MQFVRWLSVVGAVIHVFIGLANVHKEYKNGKKSDGSKN